MGTKILAQKCEMIHANENLATKDDSIFLCDQKIEIRTIIEVIVLIAIIAKHDFHHNSLDFVFFQLTIVWGMMMVLGKLHNNFVQK